MNVLQKLLCERVIEVEGMTVRRDEPAAKTATPAPAKPAETKPRPSFARV